MPSGFTIRPLDVSRRFRERKPRAKWEKILHAPNVAIRWLWRKKEDLGWRKSFLYIFSALSTLFVLYALFLWLTLPSLSEEKIFAASQSTVITDRNGIELYRIFGEQDRTNVPGSDIPQHTKQAIIAIEDRRYFERGCIDVRALARAVLSFGNSGGASTLTRQLARNALNLKREYLLNRKIKEFILGCQMESEYTKEELLNLYLNWIPFGQNAYGVEQASSRYFGKHAKELTLGESAILASLPQLPSYFSPYGRHVHTDVSAELRAKILDGTVTSVDDILDDDVTIGLLGVTIGSGATVKNGSGKSLYVGGRADQVLRSMQDAEFITDDERLKATEELKTLTFKKVREDIRAPHFVLWAKDQAETLFANSPDKGLLERGGLTIQTTLDWRLQEAAEQVVAAHKD
ncbi:MAG: penicillin-binding protein, partial [Candidatus Peribacteraceae bacterium]|nr:penicillin-binding protein [Candidatus Peribacteraceae bacterium]